MVCRIGSTSVWATTYSVQPVMYDAVGSIPCYTQTFSKKCEPSSDCKKNCATSTVNRRVLPYYEYANSVRTAQLFPAPVSRLAIKLLTSN